MELLNLRLLGAKLSMLKAANVKCYYKYNELDNL